MNKETYSRTLDFVKFPLIVFIVTLHCYTAVRIDNGLWWHCAYPFLTIGEIGVPSFFFISGLLYFFNVEKGNLQYRRKTKSRVKTLLIPYIIWNTLMFLLYFLIQSNSTTASFINGGSKPIAEYSLTDFICGYLYQGDWALGSSTPYLSTMWYVRNLMALCLFAPVIYYVTKYLKWLWVLILCLWWMTWQGVADYSPASIFFFCLGAHVKINNIDVLGVSSKVKKIFFILYSALFVTDYLVHTEISGQYPLYIHRINLIASIYAVLLVGEKISRNFQWNETIAGSTFFIYALHYPLTMALRKATVKFVQVDNGLLAFAIYIATIFIVVGVCLLVYRSMKKVCPSFLNLLTGSRN